MRSFGLRRTTEQPTWHKSSFCASGECVEVAQQQNGMIVLRDSRQPRGGVRYTAEEWQAFINGVKAGEFDLG